MKRPRVLLLNVSAIGCHPINSLKVKIYLPKSNTRVSLVKVLKQLAPRQEIISPYEPQTNGKESPLASKTMDQENHRIAATRLRLSRCRVEEKGTKTGKVAKGKKNKSKT